MSRAGSQERTLLGLLARLRPRWRSDAALPAAVDALLSGDRRLGSRDRRLYRELVYTALRYLPWIEPLLDTEPAEASRRVAWLAADTPEVRPYRDEIARGLPPCPRGADARARVLGSDADALTPGWLREECPEAFGAPLRDALLSRAPLWVRLQADDPSGVLREFESRGWAWERSALAPRAVKLPTDADVAGTEAWRSGRIEVQDAGSQRVLDFAAPAPGGRWLDACAGAGGKTLQLAAALGPAGRVTARDVRRAALEELRARAHRAGLEARIDIGGAADPAGGYDGVLVDAPCSGSGTWRRSPHLRWVTTPAGVRAASRRQLALLRENAPRVRAGGVLLYATCSLCRTENERVAEAFLAAEGGFAPAPSAGRLSPDTHDGDGFFAATFRRA